MDLLCVSALWKLLNSNNLFIVTRSHKHWRKGFILLERKVLLPRSFILVRRKNRFIYVKRVSFKWQLLNYTLPPCHRPVVHTDLSFEMDLWFLRLMFIMSILSGAIFSVLFLNCLPSLNTEKLSFAILLQDDRSKDFMSDVFRDRQTTHNGHLSITFFLFT